MLFPVNLLNLLIDEDAFRVCPLMRTRDFITYCKERNISVDVDRLRQFERIGVFRPLLRAYSPEILRKIQTVKGGYRDLGELENGDEWAGETQAELASFDPTTKLAQTWRDHGLLWVPGQGEWEHEAMIDTDPDRHEALYSRFQIWPLHHVASALTMTVQLEWATNADGSPNTSWSPRLRQRASNYGRHAARSLRGWHNDDKIAVLAQLLANRFFLRPNRMGAR